jgi:hypothetical protein
MRCGDCGGARREVRRYGRRCIHRAALRISLRTPVPGPVQSSKRDGERRISSKEARAARSRTCSTTNPSLRAPVAASIAAAGGHPPVLQAFAGLMDSRTPAASASCPFGSCDCTRTRSSSSQRAFADRAEGDVPLVASGASGRASRATRSPAATQPCLEWGACKRCRRRDHARRNDSTKDTRHPAMVE